MPIDAPEPRDDRGDTLHARAGAGRTQAGGHTLRCMACDDVIGVYEPIVQMLGGEPSETSRAARPGAGALAGPLWHRDCWPGRH